MSLFSVALICIILVSALTEAFRGYKLGLTYSVIRLGTTVISITVAAILAEIFSNPIAVVIANSIFNIEDISIVFVQLPSLSFLVPVYIDAIITPFVFLAIFFPIRFICSLCVRLILKAIMKNHKLADIEGETNTYGAVIGTICGILCAAVVVAPLSGSLSVTKDAAEIIEKNQNFIEGVAFDTKELNSLKKHGNDIGFTFIDNCTREILYNTLAISYINNEKLVLGDEVENIDSAMYLFSEIIKLLRNSDQSYPDKAELIREGLEKLSDSVTFKYIAADFLSEASKAWLNGENYMNIPKFSSGVLIDPIINEMLKVCSKTTAETAMKDLSTVLNIYLLAIQNGLTNPQSYEEILQKMDDGHLLDAFCNELSKNDRMAYIVDGIWTISLRVVSFMIVNYDYRDGEYLSLMQQLATMLNSAREYKYEERLDKLSTNINENINSTLNIDMPKDVCKILAEAMESEINTADGVVRPSDIMDFFNSYS